MPSTDVPPPDVTDREVAITHRRWRKPALVAALAVALVFAAVAASPVWEDATHILGGTWLSETREATFAATF
jgi:hypothetical protein